MLYQLIKPIIRMSLLVFFRRIDVIGKERLPKNGPVIYVSNHPSALMDPLVVAVSLRDKLHFLTGANWFGKGLRAKIFRTQFNMIPVHRPWLAKGEKVSNEDMFTECYISLRQGKSIILFPEASSTTVSTIRELKTGAIRIKDGFEASTQEDTEVPIIPIGLSYSNPHEFQSRVVVAIGKPVDFDGDYRGLDPAETARAKTAKIHSALEHTIVNIQNNENVELVKQVTRLFIDSYKLAEHRSSLNAQGNFEYAQNVAKAIDHFETADPENYKTLASRITRYFENLRDLGISDDLIAGARRSKPTFIKLAFLIVLAPLAAAGLIIFSLPYLLTKLLFRKKLRPMISRTNDEDAVFDGAFTGSLIFAVGMLISILWSIVIGIATWWFIGSWIIGLGASILVFPLVRFALFYAKIGLRVRHHFKGQRTRKQHTQKVAELELERGEIIEELRGFQERLANEIINDN
jgi:1-acyl-sn-glycerol-3-phosphate acyltransferase